MGRGGRRGVHAPRVAALGIHTGPSGRSATVSAFLFFPGAPGAAACAATRPPAALPPWVPIVCRWPVGRASSAEAVLGGDGVDRRSGWRARDGGRRWVFFFLFVFIPAQTRRECRRAGTGPPLSSTPLFPPSLWMSPTPPLCTDQMPVACGCAKTIPGTGRRLTAAGWSTAPRRSSRAAGCTTKGTGLWGWAIGGGEGEAKGEGGGGAGRGMEQMVIDTGG